jgi:hypothetical protein
MVVMVVVMMVSIIMLVVVARRNGFCGPRRQGLDVCVGIDRCD